jgi:hypothetical protein
MSVTDKSPKYLFLGSTEFYVGSESDDFTPSYNQAKPLVDHVGTRSDGTIPEWIDETSTKTPAEQFVEWFNYIWHSGDPSLWGTSIFTADAVMIDPSGVYKGAKHTAALFLLLFRFFPDLRGEVVSWAANEREIFINWRFARLGKVNSKPLLVTVVDKFCFSDGRVSFNLAYYDVITLASYLAESAGQDQLFDFLLHNLRQSRALGGMQFLPRMLRNFAKGLFVWPSPAQPTGLTATPEDGFVKLEWPPVRDAISYKVCRANSVEGPYLSPAASGAAVKVEGTSYIDRNVINGTPYWYSVSGNFGRRSVTVKKRTGNTCAGDESDFSRAEVSK